MGSFLRRRVSAEGSNWTVLSPRNFNGNYTINNVNTGSTFTISSDGSYIQAVSNGQNQNTSDCYLSRRFIYNDIKNKRCRLTWNIECTDPTIVIDGTNTNGNVTIDLFNQRAQLTGAYASTRVSKKDISTSATYLGTHTIEFVPSELFEGLTTADWIGWHIGFRSNINGATIRINSIIFAVEGSYAEAPLYPLNVGTFTFPHYVVSVLDGNTIVVEHQNTTSANGRFNISSITDNDSTNDMSNVASNHAKIWTLLSGKVDVEFTRTEGSAINASITIRKANTTSHALGGDLIGQTNAVSAVAQKTASADVDIGAVNFYVNATTTKYTNTYKIYLYNNGVRYI